MGALHSRYIGGNLLYWDAHPKRLVGGVGVDVVQYFEDFTHVAVASDAIAGWTTTLVEAGAGESTVTRPDASGGTLLLTTDANEDDGIALQLTTGESFGFASGQQATYFGCRFQSGEATQSDILLGLCITDTTPLGGMTDGVYMEKLDGGTGISCVTEKDSSETQTDSAGTFVADAYTIWEFLFDGTSVEFFIDGVSVAQHTLTIPNDELLTPTVHFLAGSAAVETMTIDWIRVVQVGR